MNNNQFFSEGETYSIPQAIKGQTPLSFYDPLKQVAYQPEVRRGADGKIAIIKAAVRDLSLIKGATDFAGKPSFPDLIDRSLEHFPLKTKDIQSGRDSWHIRPA